MRARHPRSITRPCAPPRRRARCRRSSRRTCAGHRRCARSTQRSTRAISANSSPRGVSIRSDRARGLRNPWTSSSARNASSCRSRATTTFPALPQIQFYANEQFPWLASVEAATDAIRAELLEVMQDPTAFSPYVTGHANRPRNDQQGMLNNPAWSAFYLWKNGEPVAGNAERCPRTLEALRDVPLAMVPNRSPSILFSLLKPGAHIPPHNGLVNTRLICHLPLVVPGRSRFRVGNETREWVEGRALAVRRHHRARGLERQRPDAGHTAVRRLAARAFRRGAAPGVGALRVDRRIQWDEAGLGNLSGRCMRLWRRQMT